MTFPKNPFLAMLFMLVLFSTFIQAQSISSKYTTLYQPENSVHGEQMNLFFEGEPISFNYTKMGLVEVSCSSSGANDAVLLDKLRYEAYVNCANAIINIRKTYTGNTCPNQTHSKDCCNGYSTNVGYSGIAVLVQEDSTFIQQHPAGSEMGFIGRVQTREEQQRVTGKNSFWGTLLAIAAIVTIAILNGEK